MGTAKVTLLRFVRGCVRIGGRFMLEVQLEGRQSEGVQRYTEVSILCVSEIEHAQICIVFNGSTL